MEIFVSIILWLLNEFRSDLIKIAYQWFYKNLKKRMKNHSD